ncbi:MAG: 2OG-Fe(II) oxygenase [Halioglobus sp.]|nr:2OG-Fe(II) oxygenase [Halioglobus sp.]
MKPYLNTAVLDAIDPQEFRAKSPFPWVNPQNFIAPERYDELLRSMPELERFSAFFGKQRKHGQASHDRYILDYERGMDLAPAWRDFIEELCSDSYRKFVCRLLGVSSVRFRFHWHFTPNGGEVSPHCDSKGKIGSQIFYLNTEQDWDWSWGGETVILDDGGRFPSNTAPSFDDFDAAYPAETRDNRCILFGRRGNSWHGVKRINCPENYYRKVFIVVFEEHRKLRMVVKKTRRLVTGAPLVTEKERLMY